MEGVTPAAPQKQPVQLVARVEILLLADGQLVVNQQTPSPIFFLGLLDLARHSVLTAPKKDQPAIEVPPPEAVPLLTGR